MAPSIILVFKLRLNFDQLPRYDQVERRYIWEEIYKIYINLHYSRIIIIFKKILHQSLC